MAPQCHISKVKGQCDRCGKTSDNLHMPEEIHGWYCAQCCPLCRAQKQPIAA